MSRPILEYKTLHYHYASEIDNAVNTMIKEGWQPRGPQHYVLPHLVQVMVRYGQEPERTSAPTSAERNIQPEL